MKTSSRSTQQRVLSAIRDYFKDHEVGPSHADIADRAGITVKRVQRYVEQLADGGYLTYIPRAPRSIRLLDRMANYSDDEVRATLAARGLEIVIRQPPSPAEGVADWGLQSLEKLNDIE